MKNNCCIKKFNSVDKLNEYLTNIISLFNKPEDVVIDSINIKYNNKTEEHENIHEIKLLNKPEQNKNKQKKKIQ